MDPQLLALQEILRVLQDLLESNKRLEESINQLREGLKYSNENISDNVEIIPSLDIKAFSNLDNDQQQIVMAINQLKGKATKKQLAVFTRRKEQDILSILKELVSKETLVSRKGKLDLGEEEKEDYYVFTNK